MTFLPGDIITEPFKMCEAMICVASGVIEILCEENDQTPLLSFTMGTVLGEASLFITVPIKTVIRASTCVELQVAILFIKYYKIHLKKDSKANNILFVNTNR